jgi:hypothetical protein
MKLKRNITVGISPGTRSTGVVVMNDGVLVDWKIFKLNEAWSDVKLRKLCMAIEHVIEQYGVTAIALKMARASKESMGINQVVLAIIRIAEERDLELYTYTVDDLKEEYAVNTMKALAQYFVHFCPDLAEPFRKERGKQNPYSIKLFEALGCAVHSKNVPSELEE